MNMSYCRFRNTVQAMEDCAENMKAKRIEDEAELKARTRFIEICVEIALGYGDEIGCDLEEITI